MGLPPNALGSVVPGSTPGTTPPFNPPAGGSPAGGVDEQTKKILAMLMQAASQKKAAGTPAPTSVPGKTDPFGAPSHMTSGRNPHAWGAQRLMYGVQSMIKNAVSQHKEEQITKAMADWEYSQLALNEFYAAQASGDQKAIEVAQRKLDAAFGDPKKLKNMAKALNQDWLNPEKTTVHGEALKRVAAKTQQTDQGKQQAKTGLQNLFKHLIQKAQGPKQPEYTDADKRGIEQEVIGKAPTTTSGATPKDKLDIARAELDLEKAANETRQKYYPPVVGADGKMVAVNKSDPNDTVVIKDHETGKPVEGIPKGPAPKVLMSNGIPYAVGRNGKIITPDSPDFSVDDKRALDGAMAAGKEKQTLRVAPEIAAQVGEPPNPGDFAKGRSDPKYRDALSTWGREVEAIKTREATASGIARAKASNEYRAVQAMDADGNVYYTTAKNAIEQGLAGASQGIQLKPREVQIKDIQVASSKAREAINALDDSFSTGQIAKLHTALTTPDDTVAQAELTALATESLTDKQQDFVVWIKQLNERAMSLRNVAGMGAGAQDLRNAIRDMLPGVRSGDKKMMNKQLDAFDNQVSILKGGIAHPGKSGGKDSKDKDPLGIL